MGLNDMGNSLPVFLSIVKPLRQVVHCKSHQQVQFGLKNKPIDKKYERVYSGLKTRPIHKRHPAWIS